MLKSSNEIELAAEIVGDPNGDPHSDPSQVEVEHSECALGDRLRTRTTMFLQSTIERARLRVNPTYKQARIMGAYCRWPFSMQSSNFCAPIFSAALTKSAAIAQTREERSASI